MRFEGTDWVEALSDLESETAQRAAAGAENSDGIWQNAPDAKLSRRGIWMGNARVSLEAGEAVICASGQSASGRLGSSSAGGQQAVAQVWLAGLLACSLPACRPKIRAGDWLPFMGIFPKLPNGANWLVSSLTDPH